MNNINKRQISIIYFFLSISFMMFTSINIFTKISPKNSILIVVLGSIISFSFLKFYIWILKSNKKNNIITNILNIVISSSLLIFTLNKTTNFINYNLLSNVNSYIILITLLLLVLYINHKGIKVIAKTAELLSYVFIIIFITSIVSLIQYTDINNISIISNIDYYEITEGITIYILLTISPIYLISQLENIEINDKYLKKYHLFSSLYILISLFLVLSILGTELTNIYINPEIIILKKISFLNIIDRIESIFSINIFTTAFIYISLCFYVLTKNIIELFKTKKKELILILSTITIFVLTYQFEISNTIFICLTPIMLILPLLKTK